MTYFAEYLEKIRAGEILVGKELRTELEKLAKDLDDPKYKYETDDAIKRINF